MNQDELQNTVLCGDALEMLKRLPDEYVQMCVTSPPYYGLRDYGAEGQIGCEQTPLEYIDRLTEIFREVRRVLKSNGTLWLNIADSYAGSGKGVWSKSLAERPSSTIAFTSSYCFRVAALPSSKRSTLFNSFSPFSTFKRYTSNTLSKFGIRSSTAFTACCAYTFNQCNCIVSIKPTTLPASM